VSLKANASGGQTIQVGCTDLGAVIAHIVPTKVIGYQHKDIGWFLAFVHTRMQKAASHKGEERS